MGGRLEERISLDRCALGSSSSSYWSSAYLARRDDMFLLEVMEDFQRPQLTHTQAGKVEESTQRGEKSQPRRGRLSDNLRRVRSQLADLANAPFT